MGVTAPSITLRRAASADARLLFDWANDPLVRSTAFNTAPLNWENHCQWLRRQLADPQTFLFIALDEAQTPVGQVRFNGMGGREFTVDVHTDPTLRGRGYGVTIISAGVSRLASETAAMAVHAFIKNTNQASFKAFLKADFAQVGEVVQHGELCHHLVLRF